MKLNSLEDLFVQQLKDLYSAETQFSKALPKMEEAASSEDLKMAFREHIEQTQKQVERLERIGEMLNVKLTGHKCHAAEGLVEESEEIINNAKEDAVRDAGLVASAQRVEHYEISGYGTVCAYAEQLGHDEAKKLLEQTLEEESNTDEKLNQLAVNKLNPQAASIRA
jgi:ferritin-like metal-binding protein YciE